VEDKIPTKDDYKYQEVEGYIMECSKSGLAWRVHISGGDPKGYWVPKKSMKSEHEEPNITQTLSIQGWKMKEIKGGA
jgi:hypothetical protein